VSAAIIGALVLGLALLAGSFLALWLDRYRLKPLPWLIGLAAWSAVFPVLARLLASTVGWPEPDLLLREPALATAAEALAVGLLAGAAPVVVIASTRVTEGVIDGALFGLAGGVGLAVFLALPIGPLHGAATWGSALVASLACAGAGATLGAGTGLGKLTLSPTRRPAGVAAAILASALQLGAFAIATSSCHRAWPDARLACDLALAAVAALALAAVLVSAASIERRLLTRQLAEEVELGVLPAWTVEVLPSYLRRVRTDWWPRRDERQEIARLLTALAFRKLQLLGLSAERLRLYALEVGRLRHRARALLALAPGSGAPTEPAE